jgi:hypothetical protein
MSRKSKIPFRNRNQTDWWIYCEVQQWVSKRQKKLLPTSRCLVWENFRLLRAKNREEAFKKALKFSRVGNPSKTKGGEWRFAGISILLPVYDDIEDGSEILWTDRGLMSVKQIQKLVKSKQQLPVFDDKKEV